LDGLNGRWSNRRLLGRFGRRFGRRLIAGLRGRRFVGPEQNREIRQPGEKNAA
jgi:hypothetical protein